MNILSIFDCPKTGCFFLNSSNQEYSFNFKPNEGIYYQSGDFFQRSGQKFKIPNQQNIVNTIDQISQNIQYSSTQIGQSSSIYDQNFNLIRTFTGVRPYIQNFIHPTQGTISVCFYTKLNDSGVYFRPAAQFSNEIKYCDLTFYPEFIQSAFASGSSNILCLIQSDGQIYQIIA